MSMLVSKDMHATCHDRQTRAMRSWHRASGARNQSEHGSPSPQAQPGLGQVRLGCVINRRRKGRGKGAQKMREPNCVQARGSSRILSSFSTFFSLLPSVLSLILSIALNFFTFVLSPFAASHRHDRSPTSRTSGLVPSSCSLRHPRVPWRSSALQASHSQLRVLPSSRGSALP